MQPLFPNLKSFNEFWLETDQGHQIYVEESGNPSGLPVIVLHGGPGAGSSSKSRCFFDPQVYHIILFDQRGAGSSKPHASLEKNDTNYLVADIEQIRQKLEIDKWIVFGGSWGVTLGLCYAQAHARHVSGLILRGVFLGREQDLDWLYKTGANRIFPDAWAAFCSQVQGRTGKELLASYHDQLQSNNDLERMAAARAWVTWEGICSTLRPSKDVLESLTDPKTAVAMANISVHYFLNDCFLEPNQLLDNMDKIKDIPGIIVHGRYDMVCALDNAFDLWSAWPNAELNIIREAGHSASESAISDALIKATKSMSLRFGNTDNQA